ncbi:MAG: triphosphoribosyl-dephospho-CoA synthase [Halanaeroarchaeum sp.]
MTARPPAASAELALLLEVAGTPKPGNVDRHRDLNGLRFEHFLAGAVGARPGLNAAASGEPVGVAFERSIAGMAEQEGGNTQFGALLLLVPLVRATTDGSVTREDAAQIVEATSVDDAVAFYRAFDHVDVFVGDPPEDAPALDVRRGSAAVPAVRERDVTLTDVMALSVPGDGVAAEWVGGFERSFRAAQSILEAEGSVLDRAADAFLGLLAETPDTLVAKQHGEEVASSVTQRAGALREASLAEREAFADDLVERGINPGTTADVTAAALYVALLRGVAV